MNGGGKERKINGGAATAHQVRDGRKELKQKYLQKDSAIVHATSPKSLAPLIHAFRKSCIHTSCIVNSLLLIAILFSFSRCSPNTV